MGIADGLGIPCDVDLSVRLTFAGESRIIGRGTGMFRLAATNLLDQKLVTI